MSLKNPSELKCIVLVNKYVKSVSLVSLKNRGQCIGLVNKYVKIMSVVSLKNLGQLQSIALIVILVKLSRKENISMRLLKLKRNGSVSVVSLKNPCELQCIWLVNKYVKIMSVVSLKNPFQLQSIALLVILVKLSGKENTSIGR